MDTRRYNNSYYDLNDLAIPTEESILPTEGSNQLSDSTTGFISPHDPFIASPNPTFYSFRDHIGQRLDSNFPSASDLGPHYSGYSPALLDHPFEPVPFPSLPLDFSLESVPFPSPPTDVLPPVSDAAPGNSGAKPRSRTKRTRAPTLAQRIVLERTFSREKQPRHSEKRKLAKELGMTLTEVEASWRIIILLQPP